MANVNTFNSITTLPQQFIPTATTETLLTDVVNGVTQTAVLSMPPNANVDGHSFRVRLIGKATGGTGATLTLKFRLGTTLAGTNVAAFVVTPAAVPVAGSNFSVVADFTWDSVSQTLVGIAGGQTCGTITPLLVQTQGTAIASAAALQFVATATFGAAVATSSVTVTEFTLEAI